MPPAADPIEPPHPAAPRPARRASLTDDLEALVGHAGGGPMTVAQVMAALHDRGLALVMLLLSLPFLVPVPLVGLSTPVGAALALYGLRVMLRMKPWLPDFLGRRSLSNAMIVRLVGVATKWGRRVERLLRPRLKFMLWPAVDVPIGLSIAFCGFFLGLPLPIPFTNAVPAVAIVLLLLGMIERDGVFVLLGELVSVAIAALCGYVVYLCWRYGMEAGWHAMTHLFHAAPATRPAAAP